MSERSASAPPANAHDIVTAPIEVPPAVVPLAYYGASIDGDWTGFGVSPDPGVAERTARYEALERYGVLHPEQTRSARWPRNVASLEKSPGVMFDFFREVAPLPTPGEPRERYRLARSVVGQPGRHALGLIPIEWIYLETSPAANTNGAAFGLTLTGAIESAQRELLERELLLRAWYGLVRSREITRDLAQHASIERWPVAFKRTAFESYWAARVPEGLAEFAARFSRPRLRRTKSLNPSECLCG